MLPEQSHGGIEKVVGSHDPYELSTVNNWKRSDSRSMHELHRLKHWCCRFHCYWICMHDFTDDDRSSIGVRRSPGQKV